MAPCQAPSTGALATDIAADLWYARCGWAVFPCEPGGKRPLTPNGFKDASSDEATIRARWMKWPDANIGLPTGARNGIWATDVDIKNGASGNASLIALEEAHSKLLPTAEQSTPSGGRHLIFRLDGASVRNTAGALGAGLDTRGEGGYIVVAPSVIDGRPYHWIAEPWLTQPAPAPQWLLDLLAKPARKSAEATGSCSFNGTDLHPYVEKALHDECANVALAKDGTRNHTLNAAAFNLGQFVVGGVLSRERAEADLADAAKRCGLGAVEIERTIRSGLEAGMQEPRGIPERTTFEAKPGRPKAETSDTAHPGSGEEPPRESEERADPEPAPSPEDAAEVDDNRAPPFSVEALALDFAAKHAAELRYVAEWSRWYRWHRSRWAIDPILWAFRMARVICRAAAAQADDNAVKMRLTDGKTEAAVERLAKADPRLAATVDQWDADPWLLNMEVKDGHR